MDDGRSLLLTIGQFASRTGLVAWTIRYWSDIGAVPPAGRSFGGHRLYDAGSVARLELVQTLRELGLGLGLGLEKMRQVLARLSAAERRKIIDDFIAEVFAGLDAGPKLREKLRLTAPELPDEPAPEQAGAWVELAELVQDPGFRQRMRTMAEYHAGAAPRAARLRRRACPGDSRSR